MENIKPKIKTKPIFVSMDYDSSSRFGWGFPSILRAIQSRIDYTIELFIKQRKNIIPVKEFIAKTQRWEFD